MLEAKSDVPDAQLTRNREWLHFQVAFIKGYWKSRCDEFGLDQKQMLQLWTKFFYGVGGVFKQLDITTDEFTVKLEQMCDQLLDHFIEFKYYLSNARQMDVGWNGAIDAICDDVIKSQTTMDIERGLGFFDVYFPNIQTGGEVRTRFVFKQNTALTEEIKDFARCDIQRLLEYIAPEFIAA